MTLRRGGPGRLTWRRFRALLNGLPAESRYQTALRNSLPKQALAEATSDHDPERERWSKLEALAAGMDERLQLLYMAVVTGLGGEPPELQRHYRPGVPKPEGPAVQTAEERALLMAAVRARWDATKTRPPSPAPSP